MKVNDVRTGLDRRMRGAGGGVENQEWKSVQHVRTRTKVEHEEAIKKKN
jgi:hypothetical protein